MTNLLKLAIAALLIAPLVIKILFTERAGWAELVIIFCSLIAIGSL